MNELEKTIKEMADELGVSKQKVYRFIRKNHITASSEALQVMRYDEAVQTLVNTHFSSCEAVKTASPTASKPHQGSSQSHHKPHQVKRYDEAVQTLVNTHFSSCEAVKTASPTASKPHQGSSQLHHKPHQVKRCDDAVQTLVNTHFSSCEAVKTASPTASKPHQGSSQLHHKPHQVKRCDDAVQTLVNTGFLEDEAEKTASKPHQTTSGSDVVLDAVILMLQEELKGKNAQIEAQQKTISELTATLQKTTETLQAAQALHAGTIQSQLETQSQNTRSEPSKTPLEEVLGEPEAEVRGEGENRPTGFWGRLFRK